MEDIDFDWWADFINIKKNSITDDEYLKICQLHSHYFNHSFRKPCKCSPREINRWIKDLNELYDNQRSTRMGEGGS